MSTKREIQVVGRESTPTGTGGEADEDRVGARYFETLGVTVARGRAITDSDRPGSPLVVVVSESMARRLWPREDPIGRRIRLSRFMSWSPPHEVVGVVRDTRYRRLEHEIAPHLYVPLSQNPDVSVNVLIRTSLEPARVAEEVRRQVTAIDPSLPAPKVMTMAGHLRESDSDSRLVATFVGLFGALALALASIGVYSLTSYAVSQQTREIGVRVALGAGRRDVFGLVVREALVLALSGVAVGLAGAFASTRAIASQLYGVSATDPLTFAFASALLPVVGVLAACLPALRSMRIEPMAALREE